MSFLSSLDNLLYDAYTIFHKGVDNFETEHKPIIAIDSLLFKQICLN